MAKKPCESNLRIIRRYIQHRKLAGRLSEESLDREIAAINRFDEWNGYKGFKHFHIEQADGFRDFLDDAKSEATGKSLARSSVAGILKALQSFFFWLSGENGYRSKIRPSYAEYFNLSNRDKALARASEPRKAPTPEMARRALNLMPSATAIHKRDRAVMALLKLTGIRDGALIGLRIKHVDLDEGCVRQPPREVKTKLRKPHTAYFLCGYDEAENAFKEWMEYQRETLLRSYDDPLFPITEIRTGANGGFQAVGVKRTSWTTASPVRRIVREAFENAGLQYYGPHSFRHMHAREATKGGASVEKVLAVSQNLAHSDLLTTLRSYGQLSDDRVKAIIRGGGA